MFYVHDLLTTGVLIDILIDWRSLATSGRIDKKNL